MPDRARNEVVDRLNLPENHRAGGRQGVGRFKMSLSAAPFIGRHVISEQKSSRTPAFLELDTFLTGLLDQMAGAKD
jgi:hypothetical protein